MITIVDLQIARQPHGLEHAGRHLPEYDHALAGLGGELVHAEALPPAWLLGAESGNWNIAHKPARQCVRGNNGPCERCGECFDAHRLGAVRRVAQRRVVRGGNALRRVVDGPACAQGQGNPRVTLELMIL